MENEITIDGNRIFYRLLGKGRPVMLIHGFGEDGEAWKNQYDSLKNDFLLIIPDLPGSGKSTMADGPWTMERFADLIKKIIEKENLSKIILIGHSMGGYIALAFAEKYPDSLNGFGLFHSTAYPDNEEKKQTRRKGIGFIKEHGGYEFLKTSTPNLFSSRFKDQNKEFIDEFIGSLRNFKGEALVSYYEAMMQRPERINVLKNMKLPVLFIMGKYDNAIPLKDGLEQCHLPQLSYIHILQNSGHMGMLEEVEKANKALQQYLINLPFES
jgi:pimeloyl-ACP methyl ester carboxylesterase